MLASIFSYSSKTVVSCRNVAPIFTHNRIFFSTELKVNRKGSINTTELSTSDIFRVMEEKIKSKQLLKKSHLFHLVKSITSTDDIQTAKSALELYKQNIIDPTEEIAALFANKCIELKTPVEISNIVKEKNRLALFLSNNSVAKTISAIKDEYGSDDKKEEGTEIVVDMFEGLKEVHGWKPASHTYGALIGSIFKFGESEKATSYLKEACEQNALQATELDTIIQQLKEDDYDDEKISEISGLIKDHNISN